MGFVSNLLTYILHVQSPDEGKSAENVAQANTSGILACKGGSVAIFSDNDTEFKI